MGLAGLPAIYLRKVQGWSPQLKCSSHAKWEEKSAVRLLTTLSYCFVQWCSKSTPLHCITADCELGRNRRKRWKSFGTRSPMTFPYGCLTLVSQVLWILISYFDSFLSQSISWCCPSQLYGRVINRKESLGYWGYHASSFFPLPILIGYEEWKTSRF